MRIALLFLQKKERHQIQRLPKLHLSLQVSTNRAIQGWLFFFHRSLRCHTQRTALITLCHLWLDKQHNVRVVYTVSTMCGFYWMSTC